MKIEFRKIPLSPKNFKSTFNSVEIEGIFCKISPSLVKVDAKLKGKTQIDCSRCLQEEDYIINEDVEFFLSDGIYKPKESEDFIAIEIENGTINFDDIILSEINSIKSDYHLCKTCLEDGDNFEKEY